MSNQIFQPYFEEQDQKAASFFATEHSDDYVADMLHGPLNLINEAFDDINTLQNYKDVLKRHANLSNENFGFISSHILSIENKYKGLISVETLVYESLPGDKKATIVAEGLETRTALLIAGVIAAIIAMLSWILGKGKAESKKTSEETKKVVISTKTMLEKMDSDADNLMKERLEENRQEKLKREQEKLKREQEALAKKIKEEEDLKKKQELEAQAKEIEAKIKEDRENQRKLDEKRAADERDARNATAPHYVSFTSSSSVLQRFVLKGNVTELDYGDLRQVLSAFYLYYEDLGIVINRVLVPTVRYGENLLKILDICRKNPPKPDSDSELDLSVWFKRDIEKIFVDDKDFNHDLGKFVSSRLEHEITRYLGRSEILNSWINPDYETINCKVLKAEVSYTKLIPHSVCFKLVANGSKKPKNKKFTLLNGITRDQCYELNKLCEGYINKTNAIFNVSSKPSKDFDTSVSKIESACKQVDSVVKSYGSTKKLYNIEGNDAEYMVSLLSGMLKNIRANVALANELKVMSEKQLHECCSLINSVARSVVKNS